MMLADLHIHGKYARGCSKNLNVRALASFGKLKGLSLIGIGDILHEKWMKEAKEELKDAGDGFYLVKGMQDSPFFCVAGEVALKDLTGKITHWVTVLPSIEAAEELRKKLDGLGNFEDGRALLEIPPAEYFNALKDLFAGEFLLIPAHIWTPYFGIFGSKVGYTSIDQLLPSKAVYAIETGLSSDPWMNYFVEELTKKAIVSFSDAHSFWPHRLGREATAFKDLNGVKDLIKAVKRNEILFTVEVPPEYGKYHYDGHRKCGFSVAPEEAIKKYGNTCPVCGRKLTLGVMHRVIEIADRKPRPEEPPRFYKLLPLTELIAAVKGGSPTSRSALDRWERVARAFGGEYRALLYADEKELLQYLPEEVVKAVLLMRENRLKIIPGYDGVYGRIVLNPEEETGKAGPKNLLDFL